MRYKKIFHSWVIGGTFQEIFKIPEWLIKSQSYVTHYCSYGNCQYCEIRSLYLESLASPPGYLPWQDYIKDKQLPIQQAFSFHATNVVHGKSACWYNVITGVARSSEVEEFAGCLMNFFSGFVLKVYSWSLYKAAEVWTFFFLFLLLFFFFFLFFLFFSSRFSFSFIFFSCFSFIFSFLFLPTKAVCLAI